MLMLGLILLFKSINYKKNIYIFYYIMIDKKKIVQCTDFVN